MIHAQEIAGRFNLGRSGSGYRGACPCCEQPAFDVRTRGGRTSARCFYCDDRQGIAAALGALEGGAGLPALIPQADAPEPSSEARTAAALRFWNGAVPASGTPADSYLNGRGLPGLAASPALRFRPDAAHRGGGRYPLLAALVQDVAGGPVAVHRTFLRADGCGKAAVDPCKMSLGPVKGGAIRLDEVAPELVVAEGLETAASAGRLLFLPAWCAVSAGNLQFSLALPPEVRAVVVAADPDPVGQRAATAAAHRWAREGRRVRVAVPDRPGADFNDLLWAQADA